MAFVVISLNISKQNIALKREFARPFFSKKIKIIASNGTLVHKNMICCRNIVTSYGQMKLTDEDADEMLEFADFDGDGQINYEEFVKLFTERLDL